MSASNFEEDIRAYRENDRYHHCPFWIWFSKIGEGENSSAACNICMTLVPRKGGSTTGLGVHLKRHHGHDTDYNAWIISEELCELKQLRLEQKKRVKEFGLSLLKKDPKKGRMGVQKLGWEYKNYSANFQKIKRKWEMARKLNEDIHPAAKKSKQQFVEEFNDTATVMCEDFDEEDARGEILLYSYIPL